MRACAVAAVVLACALPRVATGAPPPTRTNVVRAIQAQGDRLSIRLEKFRLANGLQVIVAEDARLPLIAFELRVGVGARNEAPGRSGLAHLF
jgi:zinc protease